MDSIEIQAKSIDIAIEQALEALKVSYDEVDVEVLSEGGLFKKGKYLFTRKNAGKTRVSADKQGAVSKDSEKIETSKKDETSQDVDKIKADTQKVVSEKQSLQSSEKQVLQNKELKKQSVKDSEKAKKVQSEPSNLVEGELPQKLQKTLSLINELVSMLDISVTVEHEITDRNYIININGDNVGMLIGRGGIVLNALQSIVTAVAISHSNGDSHRVLVNIEDYRARREETLKALALKKADKVKESGRYIRLDPMTARERALVHSALQDVEGIKTYSTGKDPRRCVCIALADDVRAKKDS